MKAQEENKQYKAYKFRIYPNKEQTIFFNKTFGCCRKVYNLILDDKQSKYKSNSKNLTLKEAKNQIPGLKDKFTYLREADSKALQNEVDNLFNGYKKFFSGTASLPKYKSKKNPVQSYRTDGTNLKILDDKYMQIPKAGKLRVKFHRQPKGTLKHATISKKNNKYYISLAMEIDDNQIMSDVSDGYNPTTVKELGLDLGIKALAVDSNGITYDNEKFFDRSYVKLSNLQQELSNMTKGSKNYKRQQYKIAKVHEKIANQRIDYLQKLSTKLINENKVIYLENLDVKAMLKNAKNQEERKTNINTPTRKTEQTLHNNISNCGWSMFVTMLKYKSNWYNRELIQIDQYFPSSQICSCCGSKSTLTKNLAYRAYTCSNCGAVIDRDYNAAKNILTEGQRIRSIH